MALTKITGSGVGLITGDIATSTAGTSNFRAGVNAGNSIASGGNSNTVVGDEAGTAITTGDENVAVGTQSLDNSDVGSFNTAIGKSALGGDQKGSRSTAVGNSALQTQNFTSATNAYNTAVGYNSGGAVTTGVENTLIGASTGDQLTTGDLNVKIGYNIQESAVGVDSAVALGTNFVDGGTNTVRLGVAAGTATLNLDGSDTSWAAASDSRLKKDIATSTVGLAFIKDLRPVTFKWNAKDAVADSLPQYDADSSDPVYGEGKAHHGFIAQEVKTVIDAHSDVVNGHNLWSEDPDGTQQVSPSALIPILVKAMQEQNALIEALTARITALE